MKKIAAFMTTIIMAFPLAACADFSPPAGIPAPSGELASNPLTEPYGRVSEYALYYQEKNYSLSLYEPEAGCYLSAYVLSNKAINYDINELDHLAGKKHAAAMYNMTLGDAFPDAWILSCVAGSRTPVLSVRPRKAYDMYDRDALSRFAVELSKYRVPMFVEFFPDPEADKADPEAYKDYFSRASEALRLMAPNAALVWSVSAANVLDCGRYYPGDENVDWVGLSVYEPLSDGGYGEDFLTALDYFYCAFQKTKPVMLSRFAVSHYSSADRAYRNQEAAAEIERVYAAVANGYPRIKLVNYMDFSGIALGGNNQGDNFSVSDSARVTEAYARAIGDARFLSGLDAGPRRGAVTQWMRSPFPVYGRGDGFFLSEEGFRLDLNVSGLSNPVEIDGAACFDIEIINGDPNKSVSVDEEERAVRVFAKGGER